MSVWRLAKAIGLFTLVGCAVAPTPPTVPGTIRSPTPAASTVATPTPQHSPTATPLPTATPDDDLAAVLANRFWVWSVGDRWAVGDYAGRSFYLRLDEGDYSLQSLPGGLLARKLDDDGLVYERINPANPVERSRVSLDSHARFQATLDPSGEAIYYATETAVRRIDLTDGSDQLVLDRSEDAELAQPEFQWSPSGRTLIAPLCRPSTDPDFGSCRQFDVVDTGTFGHSRIRGRFLVHATTDAWVLARDERDIADRAWVLVPIAGDTTRRVATDWIDLPGTGYALDDTRFIVSGLSPDRTTYSIVLVDTGTESEQLIFQSLWEPLGMLELRDWSVLSPRWVVLTRGPLTGLDENGQVIAPIYDVERFDFDTRTAEFKLP